MNSADSEDKIAKKQPSLKRFYMAHFLLIGTLIVSFVYFEIQIATYRDLNSVAQVEVDELELLKKETTEFQKTTEDPTQMDHELMDEPDELSDLMEPFEDDRLIRFLPDDLLKVTESTAITTTTAEPYLDQSNWCYVRSSYRSSNHQRLCIYSMDPAANGSLSLELFQVGSKSNDASGVPIKTVPVDGICSGWNFIDFSVEKKESTIRLIAQLKHKTQDQNGKPQKLDLGPLGALLEFKEQPLNINEVEMSQHLLTGLHFRGPDPLANQFNEPLTKLFVSPKEGTAKFVRIDVRFAGAQPVQDR